MLVWFIPKFKEQYAFEGLTEEGLNSLKNEEIKQGIADAILESEKLIRESREEIVGKR